LGRAGELDTHQGLQVADRSLARRQHVEAPDAGRVAERLEQRRLRLRQWDTGADGDGGRTGGTRRPLHHGYIT